MSTETFVVALVAEPAAGWLVDAPSAGAAVDHVHRTTRARECWRGELLVWSADWYRRRYLAGGPFPPTWERLSA